MSVLAIIQARLGSTRLPQKALAWIGDRTLIDHVFERALQIPQVDHVVLAVPAGEGMIHPWATEIPGVASEDVLGRFATLVESWPDADRVVRICGDCPLFDPEVAGKAIRAFDAMRVEYVWNVTDGYCDGEDVEIFSRRLLLEADREATDPADREHVTPWMRRHYPYLTIPPARPGRRKTSVDTMEDLEYVRSFFNEPV